MKIALNIYKYLPVKGGGEGYLANLQINWQREGTKYTYLPASG
jgi:hypothetical protein